MKKYITFFISAVEKRTNKIFSENSINSCKMYLLKINVGVVNKNLLIQRYVSKNNLLNANYNVPLLSRTIFK